MSHSDDLALASGFIWSNSFFTKTDVGFEVRYHVTCRVDKIDNEAFRRADMFDAENQRRLVADWHDEIFIPHFRDMEYSFRYLIDPFPKAYYWNPCACHIVGDEIVSDPGAHELIKAAATFPTLNRHGCMIGFMNLTTHNGPNGPTDADLIRENYAMIEKRFIKDVTNQPAYRILEETVVAALWKKKLDLEQDIAQLQTRQEHASRALSIKVRASGKSLELTWAINPSEQDCLFRGYRNQGEGASNDPAQLDANGQCIIETRSIQGKVVLTLRPGVEYFFSFFVTRESPVYAEQEFLDSIFKPARLLTTDIIVVDSLRFTFRTPTDAEIARLENRITPCEPGPTIDPRREKLNKAFEALQSFVEFDESLTLWERQFTKQIESKNYSPEEKHDRIEKLRSAVESLRVDSM